LDNFSSKYGKRKNHLQILNAVNLHGGFQEIEVLWLNSVT